MERVMLACIVLHNMVVDEREPLCPICAEVGWQEKISVGEEGMKHAFLNSKEVHVTVGTIEAQVQLSSFLTNRTINATISGLLKQNIWNRHGDSSSESGDGDIE